MAYFVKNILQQSVMMQIIRIKYSQYSNVMTNSGQNENGPHLR